MVTGKRQESTAGTIASIIIPGYDAAACLFRTCSTSEKLWAAADILPWGKVTKLRKLGRLARLFKRACGCFAAGTLVATPDGLVAIESIKVGDLVLAYDEATGKVAAKRVTDLIRPEPKQLYELVAYDAMGGRSVFHVTDDHPWKIEGKGWVETAQLQASQRIETAKAGTLLIQSVTLTQRVEVTYNLTVDDWHTFLVGDDSAIVHNADCKKAMREFRINKKFRDYVHREKQKSGMAGDGAGTRNRDLSEEEIGEMYEDWLADGVGS